MHVAWTVIFYFLSVGMFAVSDNSDVLPTICYIIKLIMVWSISTHNYLSVNLFKQYTLILSERCLILSSFLWIKLVPYCNRLSTNHYTRVLHRKYAFVILVDALNARFFTFTLTTRSNLGQLNCETLIMQHLYKLSTAKLI